MEYSTLQKIANTITIEQLLSILDKVELNKSQRKGMKKEALYYDAHDFILTNSRFVEMNYNEFKSFIK